MGDRTRAEFVTETIDRVGVGTTNGVYTPTRFGRWFYQTYLHLTLPNVYAHPEMETTEYVALSSSSSRVTLANEYRKIYSVALVNEDFTASPSDLSQRITLRQRLPRYFDHYTKQTRQPTEYAHWSRQLELNAVPNTDWAARILQVRGYLLPPDVAASAVTLISADWDEVIEAGMVHRFYIASQQEDKIEYSREDYARLINERGGFNVQSGDDLIPSLEMASESIDWRQSGNG